MHISDADCTGIMHMHRVVNAIFQEWIWWRSQIRQDDKNKDGVLTANERDKGKKEGKKGKEENESDNSEEVSDSEYRPLFQG